MRTNILLCSACIDYIFEESLTGPFTLKFSDTLTLRCWLGLWPSENLSGLDVKDGSLNYWHLESTVFWKISCAIASVCLLQHVDIKIIRHKTWFLTSPRVNFPREPVGRFMVFSDLALKLHSLHLVHSFNYKSH